MIAEALRAHLTDIARQIEHLEQQRLLTVTLLDHVEDVGTFDPNAPLAPVATAPKAWKAPKPRPAATAPKPPTSADRWDYEEVARVARAAHAHGESMTTAVQGMRPGTTTAAAYMAITNARKQGHEIPTARVRAEAPAGRPPAGSDGSRVTTSAVTAAEAALDDDE